MIFIAIIVDVLKEWKNINPAVPSDDSKEKQPGPGVLKPGVYLVIAIPVNP